MKYYIIENEAPVGPFEVNELLARGLRPADLVWTEGMADWAPAESVEEVRMALYGPKTASDVYQTPVQPMSPAPGMCPPPAPQRPVNDAYQQPVPDPSQQGMVPPNNWLAASILATLFCCLPFGIVGIVKAAQVNGQWNSGNYEQAYKSAADAKKWTLISVITGVVVSILYFGIMVLGGFMSMLG